MRGMAMVVHQGSQVSGSGASGMGSWWEMPSSGATKLTEASKMVWTA